MPSFMHTSIENGQFICTMVSNVWCMHIQFEYAALKFMIIYSTKIVRQTNRLNNWLTFYLFCNPLPLTDNVHRSIILVDGVFFFSFLLHLYISSKWWIHIKYIKVKDTLLCRLQQSHHHHHSHRRKWEWIETIKRFDNIFV